MARRDLVVVLALCAGCFSSAPEVMETGEDETATDETATDETVAEESGEPGPGGCRDNTVEQEYGIQMAGCDGSATQCDAEGLCADGWHLCPFDEYNERGGDLVPSNDFRWISACLREIDQVDLSCPPSTTPCQTDCLGSVGGQTIVTAAFDCSDATPLEMTEDAGPVGVLAAADPQPRRLGCADGVPCAFLAADLSSAEYGAMCCLNL